MCQIKSFKRTLTLLPLIPFTMFTPKVVDVVAFVVMFNGVRIVINHGMHNGYFWSYFF
jgi:hypothetical protein